MESIVIVFVEGLMGADPVVKLEEAQPKMMVGLLASSRINLGFFEDP